tara:strand:- start:166 stop:627 length:462 start_codon:yes stop_codon:yes gene_type:complete
MSIIQQINELMNIKITHDLSQEKEEELIDRRRQLRSAIQKKFKFFSFECDNCRFETRDIFTLLKHEKRCYQHNFNMEEIMSFIEKQKFKELIPSDTQCKLCLKKFGTKNLLSQHINRGVKNKCVDRVLSKVIQGLSQDEKVMVFHYARNLQLK